MKKYIVILVVALVVMSGVLAAYLSRPQQWNVILIQADTLRADHLGCYGYSVARTPNLDRLAAEGVLFEQHMVNATYTATSVPSLLTGNYQYKHGVWYQGDTFSLDAVTLPERLLESGYRTGGFSANPVVGVEKNYMQGLETGVVVEGNANARRITNLGLEWLESDDKRPFFLWLFYIDPHFPYTPPWNYAELFEGAGDMEKSLSWDWERWGNGKGPKYDRESLLWGDLATEVHVRQELALYDGEIAYLDAQIGRLLDSLDATGLRDNTLIVFTSDHGEEHGEHGFFCSHGHSTYEAVSRVPLIIQTPDRRSSVVSQVVRTVDIAPTILDLLGIPLDEGIDGRSLEPLVLGTAEEIPRVPAYVTNAPIHEGFFKRRPRIFLSGIEGVERCVRTEEWKLIRIPHPEEDIIQLFNIAEDPEETVDLSRVEPERVAALMKVLEEVEASAMVSSREAPEQPELDEETLEMLEGLGYLAN